jgi:HPt (histidine-containing phosphotransfer) domain-containing protein
MEKPNLDYFYKIADGDQAIIDKFVSILKSEFPQQLENYNENIAIPNYHESSEAVHKLKHKIGILGLEESYKLTGLFEQNLRNQKLQYQKEFEVIIKNITNFIQKL